MKGFLLVPFLGLAFGSMAGAAGLPSLSRQTNILGQAFGFNLTSAANEQQTGLSTSFNATILGKQKSLIQANVQPNADFSAGQLQVYVNGVQVSSSQGSLEGQWNENIPIPPVNVKGTIVTIPVGPLFIQVDGGYSLSGGLDTGLALGFGKVEADINASIQASGYIQGSVGLLVIRGGVEGQIDVADGAVQTKADLYFGKAPPDYTPSGEVSFFSGDVAAFADYYALFSGWQRFWNATVFNWNGLCFDFATGAQVNQKCAVN